VFLALFEGRGKTPKKGILGPFEALWRDSEGVRKGREGFSGLP